MAKRIRRPRRTKKAPGRFPRPGIPLVRLEPGDYIGMDEVGTGAWAGPICVAAVAIKPNKVPGVRDSKTVKEDLRYELAEAIKQHAIAWKVVLVQPATVDKMGLDFAWDKAMCEAIKAIREECDWKIIIDGDKLPTQGMEIEAFPKADRFVYQVSAASLVAKAHRDNIMLAAAQQYPGYLFEKNKGYGTRAHILGLKKLGACPIHRKSLRPVKDPNRPLPKEELVFNRDTALKFVDSLKDIDNNPFASDWEKGFAKNMSNLLDRGVELSPRRMFFLQAISRRRRSG